ncbi:hypothetical protein BDZ90DRAFT_279657 [Jaminaea rosea]|uniref:Uncharacterized protein n=1 Tax=Jaminaea rosea TaxID=1569628 RepID=A0A316UPR1_9BASI|nr:hypothetical protein BDZ90DRAFT_279657 [Jaminaea rosea]PWN27292.1 hypothetical protein BDZ90DRAFT_279657 [Jaminaea rosea]
MISRSPALAQMRRRIVLILILISLISLALIEARPSPLRLSPRQQAPTGGSNTDGGSSTNGGAQSAADAAQAAGSSIDTGSGGDRSTPATRAEFARLLSGTFFGCLVSLFLGGAVLVQVWSYFERHGRRGSDKLGVQLLVAVLGLFSLASNAVLVHRIYFIHVANFGDFAFPLLTIGWELTVNYICIACMTTLVQLYYANRVWSAYNCSRWFWLPLVLLIAYSFAGGVASGALSYRSGSAANVRGSALHDFQPNSTPWQWSVVFASWLICCSTVDVGLCVLLALQLIKMKSPYFSTRHAVARLLTLSFETCFITVGFSLGAMILFLAEPQQFYFLILLSPLGQVSAASLIATLMARPSIAAEIAQTDEKAIGGAIDAEDVDAFASRAPPSIAKPLVKRIMKREERRRESPVQVTMTTTIHQEAEEEDAAALPEGWSLKKSASDLSGGSGDSYSPKTTRAFGNDESLLPTHHYGEHFLAAVKEESTASSPAAGTPQQPKPNPFNLTVANKTPEGTRRGGSNISGYFGGGPPPWTTPGTGSRSPTEKSRDTGTNTAITTTPTSTLKRGAGPPSAWPGSNWNSASDRDSYATEWSTASAAYPSSGIPSTSIATIRANMRASAATSAGGGVGGGRASSKPAKPQPQAPTYGYL